MTGYCPVMVPARPPLSPITDTGPSGDARGPEDGYDPLAEQDEARRARAERDARLTVSERLERLHRLCAQLATMTPVPRAERD